MSDSNEQAAQASAEPAAAEAQTEAAAQSSAEPEKTEEAAQAAQATPEANANSEVTGKKVFFLYPSVSVQNQIITELVQQEYEVYVAKDHAKLARVLKKYPDSLLFVNIDSGMQELEWERWLGAVYASMPEIKTGVFTSNATDELKDRYVKDLHIACGFMPLKLDMNKTISRLLEMLKVMNVKGRRKYLRASTELETTATINMPHGSDFIKGTIKDISVVGVSCSFEEDPGFKKNAFFKDIQIRLQTNLLKVEAVVFGSRDGNGDRIYVLIFTQRIDPDVRVKIRKYIQQNLQNKMDLELS